MNTPHHLGLVGGRWSAPSPLRALRRRAAAELHFRVAGPEATVRAHRIWQTPGERWFTPDDPIWRVHADASMFGAGIRALLLQALHPLAMAGVADHSDYREDPWGRLQRTSMFISMTTFGTISDAERLMTKIRGVHRRVHGVAPDGRPYRADDPHLLAWVHAAEIESFLTMHQAFGARPLTPSEANTYVAQTGSVSKHLGLLDPPTTTAELYDLLDSYGPELVATPEALDVARFVVREPPLSRGARTAYAALADSAVTTLPTYARDLLGLQMSDRALARRKRIGAQGIKLIRWLLDDPALRAARGQSSNAR